MSPCSLELNFISFDRICKGLKHAFEFTFFHFVDSISHRRAFYPPLRLTKIQRQRHDVHVTQRERVFALTIRTLIFSSSPSTLSFVCHRPVHTHCHVFDIVCLACMAKLKRAKRGLNETRKTKAIAMSLKLNSMFYRAHVAVKNFLSMTMLANNF